MGKKKQEVKTTQQQSYNTQNDSSTSVPDTPDIQAYRGWQPQTDPGLAAQYGNAKNEFRSSFNDPMGPFATAATRAAQQATGLRRLNQDQAEAFRRGTYDVNQQRGGQLGSLAALTRGSKSSGTSSGSGTGSGTQTTTQSGGLLEQILGAAAQVGMGFATGGASSALGAGGGLLGGGKNRGGGNAAQLPIRETPWGLIPGSGM